MISHRLQQERGFTLVEVVLVIIIAGILISVALTSGTSIQETSRVEEAKAELDQIAIAIAGDRSVTNNGVRTDFGYVGDVGALPPDLGALATDPGLATWDGPYIRDEITQNTGDYATDPWGATYSYTGGVEISSTGGGSGIVRKVAGATSELLDNSVGGTVLDVNGSPPGTTYNDSVNVILAVPNGSGGMNTLTAIPDAGGSFSFGSIPIGHHRIVVRYLPTSDSLARFVSVTPSSDVHATYRLNDDLWYDTTTYSGGGGGGTSIIYEENTSELFNPAQCNNIRFDITNTTGGPITISSLQLNWTGPDAYYKSIKWDGVKVHNTPNPSLGTGDTAPFTTSQTIDGGESVTLTVELFKNKKQGGQNVDMSNLTVSVLLSDGSYMEVPLGAC